MFDGGPLAQLGYCLCTMRTQIRLLALEPRDLGAETWHSPGALRLQHQKLRYCLNRKAIASHVACSPSQTLRLKWLRAIQLPTLTVICGKIPTQDHALLRNANREAPAGALPPTHHCNALSSTVTALSSDRLRQYTSNWQTRFPPCTRTLGLGSGDSG